MPLFSDPFAEIAAVLVVSAAMGALALWLRQPLIIAFIVAGILLGRSGVDWVRAHDEVDLFAELGIGVLLFVVGLKLDLHLIRSVGPVAFVAGAGQMILTAGGGFLIAWQLGLSPLESFYVAAAVAFSSTIIIVKLLSDKREIDALHGKIAVGVLIMQDIVVVLLMLGLTAFSGEDTEGGFVAGLLGVAAKGAGFLVAVALATRLLLPRLLHSLARQPELLALFGIAWAIGLAAFGGSLGFSKEVGAFVAGVALAATPYKAILGARLVGLRDFLLLFFFINLGVKTDFGLFGEVIGPALLLSAFVLILKPLSIMLLVGAAGYARRTAVTTGLAMGQISEFSLILAALGAGLGHIGDSASGIITLVGLITMGVSTYMIIYDYRIYAAMLPLLKKLRRMLPRRPGGQTQARDKDTVDVIVFGLGRYGRNLVQELQQRNYRVLGVDFDPERVRYWWRQGLATLYGDLEDDELYHSLPLGEAQWVVCTVPGVDRGRVLLHALRQHGFNGRVAVTAEIDEHGAVLESAGASLVLLPFRDAASKGADFLNET